jgi:hypothetical protein
MDQSSKPVEVHPEFTDERLSLIAHLISNAVNSAARRHQSTSGDDGWSLGCVRFARIKNLLIRKAQSGDWPWLAIINPGKKFIFSIGGVPIRFYRGKPDSAPERTLVVSSPEFLQMSLAFEGMDAELKKLCFRFAIETGILGETVSVVFAALAHEGGAPVHSWKINIDNDSAIETDLQIDNSVDMIDIPPAPIEALEDAKETRIKVAADVGRE